VIDNPARSDRRGRRRAAGAIAASQITVFYRPIVAVGNGQVTGAEALARWLHPDRGIILPESFIGLAEQSDVIGALGDVVLRRACGDAAGWSAHAGVAPKVAVNVSGQQLQDPAFPATVQDCLARSGLAASRLVLEVTETTVARTPGGSGSAGRAAGARDSDRHRRLRNPATRTCPAWPGCRWTSSSWTLLSSPRSRRRYALNR
jgi:hypothetical protein